MLIPYAALALTIYLLYWLFTRVLAAALLLMVLSTAGCVLNLQTDDGPRRICFPANNWRCSPLAEWSEM